jgi:hypothetical protein
MTPSQSPSAAGSPGPWASPRPGLHSEGCDVVSWGGWGAPAWLPAQRPGPHPLPAPSHRPSPGPAAGEPPAASPKRAIVVVTQRNLPGWGHVRVKGTCDHGRCARRGMGGLVSTTHSATPPSCTPVLQATALEYNAPQRPPHLDGLRLAKVRAQRDDGPGEDDLLAARQWGPAGERVGVGGGWGRRHGQRRPPPPKYTKPLDGHVP